MMRITRLLLPAAVAVVCIGSARVAVPGESPFSFARNYIDTQYGGSGKSGWVSAGDMDGDEDLDIVADGGRALYVYENDGKGRRFRSLDGTGEMGVNGAALFDGNPIFAARKSGGEGDSPIFAARKSGQSPGDGTLT